MLWATTTNKLWGVLPSKNSSPGVQEVRSDEVDAAPPTDIQNSDRLQALPRQDDTPSKRPLPLQFTHQSGGAARTSGPLLHPPSPAQLREDIAENPHRPPAQLLAFSVEMAKQVSRAAQDPALAREIMVEFVGIVTAEADEVPDNVSAACLRQALALSRAHPELVEHYETLRSQASPRALKLATF